jgi:hypothetical protein
MRVNIKMPPHRYPDDKPDATIICQEKYSESRSLRIPSVY